MHLKQYVNNYILVSEGIYKLISILCQFKHNYKYITYFVNIYNGLWYSYIDNIITHVDMIDINAIPLILIYQIKNTIPSNYKTLKRDNIYYKYDLEKNTNKKLYLRAIKSEKKVLEEQNKNDLLKQKVEELEKLLEEKEKNIKEKNEEKIKILIEKQIELDKLSEKYNKIIDGLNTNIDQKERENISLKRELSRYPIKLSINEWLISIIFLSSDENIEYPIICKNTDDFRRVEKLFFNKYPEYKLVILGEGNHNYIESLKRLANEANCLSSVIFKGLVSNVSDYMQKATALIVGSHFEGFGRMTAEACFDGCIVIGKNSGGTREILSQTGGFLYDTQEEMLAFMEDVAKFPEEKYYSIAKKAQQTAQNLFSIEKYTEKIYSIYTQVLKK